MKKSLFALAALGAFASAAQAQSTVTLYGTFDTSLGYATGVPANNTNTITTKNLQTTAQTTGSMLAYIDGSFATSSWGMRGSEDLGGGRKANFHLESDILTNTGETHSSGLFRRAANVSLADASLGELFMGRRGNAYIIATGSMLPVQGNTVHQWRSVIGSSVGDQISNSITYSTPKIFDSVATVQYGLNNAVDNGDDASMFAANFFNTSIKNLTISAAYNNMKAASAAKAQLSGANKGGSALNAGTSTASATAASASATNIEGTNQYKSTGTGNLEGYAVGLKYKATPVLEVGTFFAHGRQNNGASAGVAATNYMSASATGVGLGYQASSSLLLGANFIRTSFAAQMVNAQAHYMLSKRTRVYSQVSVNQGATGNNQSSTYAAGSFSPIHCNSSSTTICADGLSSSGGGNSKASNTGYVAGIIHTF